MSTSSRPQIASWLFEEGARQTELFLSSVVYSRTLPLLVTDDDLVCREVSRGGAKLLGVSRKQIVGHRLDDFAAPGFRIPVHEIRKGFQQGGEQPVSLRLTGSDGSAIEVECMTKGDILPGRHALALREIPSRGEPQREDGESPDYAVYLFDPDGRITAWYSGAERIFGYTEAEAIGRPVSTLHTEPDSSASLDDEMQKATAKGHFACEQWHSRKDRSRLWANVLTTALRNDRGELEGFARMVRDCSERQKAEEALRLKGVPTVLPGNPATTGFASGEFDRVVESNDVFLDFTGYSREDVAAGRLYWPDLSPPEFAVMDELAHEEALRYGACAPYETEFLRKDGTRVQVLVVFAVLNLTPLHWIAMVRPAPAAETGDQVFADETVIGDFAEIVGRSAETRRVLQLVETVAPTDATVLILGETGTGKELVARALHRLSRRKNFPFVTLNCAAIPTGLLESELFGYERGAFTGALSQKIGRFEMANGGTLFLDEVGDIPLELQPKLLRALQEKSFERLGGTRTIPIDVRLIAATNRDLAQMMGNKLFRSDLYYRLKVFPIQTPALRERPEDIPTLVRYFTRKYAQEMGKHVDVIPAEAMRALVKWRWPGNVRELENFIERSVILSTGNTLHVPLGELRAEEAIPATGTLEEMERQYILQVLKESNGVVSTAAARLGMPRTTLNARMQKLGISRREIRSF